MNNAKTMNFWSHLEELRSRLVKSAWLFVILFCISFYYSQNLYHFLQRPLLAVLESDSFFIATSPLSGWLLFLKVSLFFSLLLFLPIFLYHVFAFINPALQKSEKIAIYSVTFFFTLFFFLG